MFELWSEHYVCSEGSDGVLLLSLSLWFVVVGVAAVQLVEHLSDPGVQPGLQKLDIVLPAQV